MSKWLQYSCLVSQSDNRKLYKHKPLCKRWQHKALCTFTKGYRVWFCNTLRKKIIDRVATGSFLKYSAIWMVFVYSSPSNFLLIDRVATAILELCFLCSFSSNFLYIFISCFIKKNLLQYLAKELYFLCSFSSSFQHSFIGLY